MRQKQFILSLFFWVIWARAETRYPITISETYAGAFQTAVHAQEDKLRLLTQQAPLEISIRLGLLQYRQGFRYPVTLRFEDQTPPGVEHAIAYVALEQTNHGFRQNLVIHAPSLAQNPSSFDTVFYHEMTHVILNDALGGEAATKLPHWVHEGLALFASGESDEWIKRTRQVVPLDGAYGSDAYGQYALAIQYMLEKTDINRLQNFVRFLVQGKATEHALQEALGMDWKTFQENVEKYSYDKLGIKPE